MILFIAGMLGIIVEVTSPGVGVPGVGGGICLLLSLWGLGILEINYVAIALLVLGVILFAVEIFTPGFGVFGTGGIIALVFGFMMVDKEPWIEVLGDVAKGVLVGLIAVFVIFVVLVRRTIRKPVKVGREAMIGEVGVAVTDIDPEGMVRLRGELWKASSKERIAEGEEVIIRDIKGLMLVVERYRKG
jgi:membrane-bound serine protease (ClpP class)